MGGMRSCIVASSTLEYGECTLYYCLLSFIWTPSTLEGLKSHQARSNQAVSFPLSALQFCGRYALLNTSILARYCNFLGKRLAMTTRSNQFRFKRSMVGVADLLRPMSGIPSLSNRGSSRCLVRRSSMSVAGCSPTTRHLSNCCLTT